MLAVNKHKAPRVNLNCRAGASHRPLCHHWITAHRPTGCPASALSIPRGPAQISAAMISAPDPQLSAFLALPHLLTTHRSLPSRKGCHGSPPLGFKDTVFQVTCSIPSFSRSPCSAEKQASTSFCWKVSHRPGFSPCYRSACLVPSGRHKTD